MIRTGWVLEEQNFYGEDPWRAIKIFMNKRDAIKELNKLSYDDNRDDYQERLREITVEENDQSIANFYNQIEQENPEYQAELTEVISETLIEIENPTPSNNPFVNKQKNITDYKKYLRHIFDEALDKNWLSTISICGGD